MTVVLATHNGGRTLDTTLQSFVRLQKPEGQWKLVVVDNSSSDDTGDIVQRYARQLPVQPLRGTTAGKNAGLNLAVPSFEGEYVVFTDDDIVVPRDWLRSYLALGAGHPEYSVFGGRIVPRWPGDPPQQILKSIPLAAAYAAHAGGGPANRPGRREICLGRKYDGQTCCV